MSGIRSTVPLASANGSTMPAATLEELTREAAEIRKRWSGRTLDTFSLADIGSACLYRHKSLILKLAHDSYIRDLQDSSAVPSLSEYCQRYACLSEPLKQSIYNMLEVQEYAIKHPSLFSAQPCFEWPQAGDEFLNFRIIEELGRGASGRVFLCESRNLGNKQVVLKVEPGRSSTEAALLGKLRHRNITPISWADFDKSMNATFMCMPFLGRSTLADLISLMPSEGPPVSGAIVETASRLWIRETDVYAIPINPNSHTFSVRSSYITRVVRLAQDLADGLAFVHGEAITHGDIKPSNVLLAPGDCVYLLDFNLGRANQTVCTKYGGTPPYMAPERVKQILLNSEKLPNVEEGIAADVFSFGVLLYELLTGKLPFEVSSGAASLESVFIGLSKLHASPYPSIRTRNPAVGASLSRLVDRCLETDPALRPRRMQDIVEWLNTLNAPPQRLGRFARRNPKVSLLTGCTLGGAVLFASNMYLMQPPHVEQLYRRAVVARESGDLLASVGFLNEAILVEPRDARLRLLRAQAYNEAEDYARAAVDLLHLERFFPTATNKAYQAYNTQLMGNHTSAALKYENAIRNGMGNSAVLNNLCLAYFLREESVPAAKLVELTQPLIEKALALNPDSAQVRMTAFTFFRRHPQRLEKSMIAETQIHVEWLATYLPNRVSISKAIYGYYSTLARHGLIEAGIVEEARQRMSEATNSEPFNRLMDPLDCEK